MRRAMRPRRGDTDAPEDAGSSQDSGSDSADGVSPTNACDDLVQGEGCDTDGDLCTLEMCDVDWELGTEEIDGAVGSARHRVSLFPGSEVHVGVPG